MAQKPGIFPTFFLSGFECSTFRWKDQGRRNLIEETQHRRHAAADYAMLRHLGIAVAREGIPWPLVDTDGYYDFSYIDPFLDAMNACQILPIWELCHYGYPDGLDPFAPEFVDRFAHYARAAAAYVVPRTRGPRFFAPMNEITFFAFIGGEWGWAAPFRKTREDRFALRRILCRADIAACKAIREIDPEARFVHFDPLVQVVAPRGRPSLAAAAREENDVDTFLAWDIIAGLEEPEHGGSPDILDIVGANVYSFGQMEYREEGPHAALPPDDDRIKPLCEMLMIPWQRYGRPMLIGETSGMNEGRSAWLKDVMEESLAAVDQGIDLHGICLFPAVDMPDWHTAQWLHNGLCDVDPASEDLCRVPADDYIAELRRWQRLLNRVTELDEDPFSDPVELADVIAAAKRMKVQPDKNWT